ncbi:protein NO VEIN-like isoform X4 [Carya illinoinensis]|uniref:protein NO VEIN-like isoform X4 n=1 Tax=Carya illinoinensis TaxID=32201 RepID=UPI001C719C3A|nr:protein NO VEIN-like isoform X4 [Carya illinoinensis]
MVMGGKQRGDSRKLLPPPPIDSRSHMLLPPKTGQFSVNLKGAWIREIKTIGKFIFAFMGSSRTTLLIGLLGLVDSESLRENQETTYKQFIYPLSLTINMVINAFIHCFIGVRRITSLYDLEVAICENEGVEKFEELELGPLLRHPLILHYFSVNSDVTEVFKITIEEILSFLWKFVIRKRSKKLKNKDITAEEFLDFIAKKQSVESKEKLGIRIQSLGMHISAIRKVWYSENATIKKSAEALKSESDKKCRKHPPLSSLKKQLNEPSNSTVQSIESFLSEKTDLCGGHKRFVSSSSDDENGDDCTSDNERIGNSTGDQNNLLSQTVRSYDQVSSCPCPSQIEDITRLGLNGEICGQPSHAGGNPSHNEWSGLSKKKVKSGNLSCTMSAPSESFKENNETENLDRTMSTPSFKGYEVDIVTDFHVVDYYNKTEEDGNLNEADLAIVNNSKRTCLSKKKINSMRSFITTWTKACRKHTVPEVFKRMLEFYDEKGQGKRKQKRIKKIESMFASLPFAGLLNVADRVSGTVIAKGPKISSIKSGMWDIIYDTHEAASEKELTNIFIEKSSEYEITDVDPENEKDAPVVAENEVELIHSVTVQDIMRKVAMYFDLNYDINGYGIPLLEILRKLYNCEFWLVEQFCAKTFKSLGYGDFLMFLEKHASLLPEQMYNFLKGDVYEKSPLEVCMLQNQLVVLVAQALNGIWRDTQVNRQMISSLLMRQFPLIGFKISEKGSVADFLDIVGKHKSNVISKPVLFSVTLFGMSHDGDLLAHHENDLLETTEVKIDISQKAGDLIPVTSKDAIELLCRAPLLSDLNLWTHWDLIFAPSLGPLVTWLLNEVNTQKLLCLVTKEGKVIRLDHSATVDSFLEAALERSPLQTAVQLLSLFSLVGGEKYVPMSLLKCHTRHAFEVIMKNLLENMEVNEAQNSRMQGYTRRRMVVETATSNLSNELLINFDKMNTAVPVISRFVLDCLGFLPTEFRGFAADILLSGMRSLIKDAASAVLSECNQTEQRLMLHEVGLSLGIVEWIDDYHAFCSTDASDLYPHKTLCLNVAAPEKSISSKTMQDVLDKPSTSEVNTTVSAVADGHKEQCTGVCQSVPGLEVFEGIGHGPTQHLSELDEHKNASLVIESIRWDEFGMDPSLSSIESSMLKKQHARLGRALHCLSHELYSQDSHFLLELVQNADDNIYPEDVEPTLTFILQESGIILLNNERGFSAQNIRALCDVGNSTKKGSNAGYIGQKGIGFKSVFRVTDAPEIHSNGFHVKFDISEGQIGFVLPTLVPPCNIDLYSRLASGDTSDVDAKQWNTCIVLPFRTRLSDGTVMNSIMTMFSDLHPSLLLFLHRLKCIKFRNLLNNSLIVMRKEIMGDGIVRVSHGKEKMTWLLASQKLQADVIRPDVRTTEISVAFTLQESIDGDCVPILEQQPVFAFLPLRTYGLKFILQGDFVLPSSREEVDGDSSWNQWLSSEFPGLFVGAERSFCSLLCFRENPGKAVSAFMSFVPLVGEVHGFFSSLPRLIISKLRMSNCLLLEGGNDRWVPPCKVLRCWDEQARILLPDGLLSELLGLGFLDRNIKMSDSLARALGIQDYGPTILLQFISSLSQVENGIKSMSLSWLSSWISAFYIMLSRSGQILLNSDTGMDLIENLKRIKFIPLSDGTYSSVNEGTIWLPSGTRFDGQHRLEAFQSLFAKLRTVSPALLSASTCDTSFMDMNLVDNLTKMFHRIGVKQLSAHEILKAHILPAVSNDRITNKDKNLMIEYTCFAMIHLQSSCPDCCVERVNIISELRNKAFILTNYGFKQPVEVSIHFSKEYGNPVNANKLINVVDMKWHEVDATYLRHPVTESTSCGLKKWREFFQEIGILDFVKICQVNKTVADISPTIFKNVMWVRDVVSPESIVNDWESHELVHLMSLLLKNGPPQCCIYLLEVLDTLWDGHFSECVTGYWNPKSGGDGKPFKSSFLSSICGVQWVVSSIDDELHYPKDLFYDCDSVRSILGASAPYAVPKVRCQKLVSDIGFKVKVTMDDILEILEVWRRSRTPFKASISQMSKLYTFIWDEMNTSEKKLKEELTSGPFIFFPSASSSRLEDVLPGKFLSLEEVCWYDPTGALDQMKEIHPYHSLTEAKHSPLNWTLSNIYPGLRDFFMDGCGVHEAPPLCSYIQILLRLSTVALPSLVANVVFQVFLMWSDGLKSGLLTPEDVIYFKQCLLKSEFMVLPTKQDKWVSLHPSFGLVCWCDDRKLKKQFKHLDKIDFLYFGKLSEDQEEILQTKVSALMENLGIPALSKVVTREAIYYGLADSIFKASLVSWALPYAQRYICSVHPNNYIQLKQSGFNLLNRLQVVVVEKLYYRNAIKRGDGASNKRIECSCLLQDNILYTTEESDCHAIYMELSRLLFNGTPDLHLANFLHMITNMAESGSTEEQTEFFILNSQKVPKLPDEESVWCLSAVPSLTKNDDSPQTSLSSEATDKKTYLNPKRKAGNNSNWPPVDWKSAPGCSYDQANDFKTREASALHKGSPQKIEGNYEGTVMQTNNVVSISTSDDWTIEDDSAAAAMAFVLSDNNNLEDHSDQACNQIDSGMKVEFDPFDLDTKPDGSEFASSNFHEEDQLRTGTPDATQAARTGRLGERVAFKYIIGKAGETIVKWVNEDGETGLPYDITVGEENSKEYIEVKATKSQTKDWFNISTREWQFAVDKGESFSIMHVVLLGNNVARVSVFKNPVKLCQLGKLQLVAMMPMPQEEFSIVA